MDNLIQQTDPKGQITGYTYDALNRISRVTYADGRTADFTYDIAGNLIRVSDSVSGEALLSYDNLNRLISETTDRGVVSYAYDAVPGEFPITPPPVSEITRDSGITSRTDQVESA